jgi:DNA adenine methylase
MSLKILTKKKNSKLHFSPLRYPGGKTFLYPFLKETIEKNKLQGITYVEPFAGGAGAALALLFSGSVEDIIINDLDKAIYSFWRSAIFKSKKFIQKIRITPITIKEWEKQKNIYKDNKSSQFDRGFATFFINRTNRSGILDGGPIGGLDQKGNWKIDARFNKEGLIERIELLAKHKDKIRVTNKDGLELIKDYLKDKNTFIYLDPPYYDKGSTLYMNHYQEDDHIALSKELNDNRDSFWLLTYDNKREIKSLYPDRRVVKFSLNYNAYESRIGKEIMILSDVIKC